jgi:putative hemolysin
VAKRIGRKSLTSATKSVVKKGASRVAANARRKLSSVRAALETFESGIKIHRFKLRSFKPNVSFSFERGKFIVKTADSGAELEECLRLRFEVFHREYQNKKRKTGIDIDKIDLICDHLVIKEKATGRVIGTYRMNSSRYTSTFYAATEFKIDELLALPGNKLELGRACIDRNNRTGAVISLLWRGIFEYARLTETRMVFGCTSVKTVEPLQIGLVTKHISENVPIEDEVRVVPLKKFRVPRLNRMLEYVESNPYEYRKDEIAAMLPALLLSYLNLGAKVSAEPALDRDFGCIDFLTILRFDDLSPAMKVKYRI